MYFENVRQVDSDISVTATDDPAPLERSDENTPANLCNPDWSKCLRAGVIRR